MNISLKLGHTPSGVPVSIRDLPNPHIYLSGRSGSGKSYFLKQFLPQAAAQGALCLCFDYSGDLHRYAPPVGVPCQHIDVAGPEFSLNPLVNMDGQERDVQAQQLLGLLHAIFRMGPRANLALRRSIMTYLSSETEVPTLDRLVQHVKTAEHPSTGLLAALEPLELLASLISCGGHPISLDLTAPGIVVLNFDRVVDRQLRSFLVELILQTIWALRTSDSAAPGCPIVLVLDECQSLNWGEGSMAVRILREGRKFDLAGWFSSQWVDKKNAVAALQQAAFQAHFRPDDVNVARLAKSLCPGNRAGTAQHVRLLQTLKVGQFLWARPGGRSIIVTVEP